MQTQMTSSKKLLIELFEVKLWSVLQLSLLLTLMIRNIADEESKAQL